MAKIRLIENDTWRKFYSLMNERGVSENELLKGLLGEPIGNVGNVEGNNIDVKGIEEWQKEYKDMIAELEEANKDLKDRIEARDLEWDDQQNSIGKQYDKYEATISKQKESILKKNTTLKDIRAKVSSLKKENKKLARQVKALTIVEEEEDGDSESPI